MFIWVLVVRSRDVAVSGLVFKTKAIEFGEKMNVGKFKTSDDWLDSLKKRSNMSFKTVSGESNASTRSTPPTNLAYFITLNQISPYI